MIACKLCGITIHFDNNKVSQRTGKKIPLDEEATTPIDAQNGNHYIADITTARIVTLRFISTTNTYPKTTSTSH